ncbi:MAG: hypothetical protein HY954_00145 [Deltaproteobacteria bacterium]|nr:hypothetical protein [Deltaproteobacteria bacterium]
MKNQFRPVFIGLLLGLFSLLFGIFWAAYMTVNHESIHRTLSLSAKTAIEEKFVLSGPGQGHEHHNPADTTAAAEGASGHAAQTAGAPHEHGKTEDHSSHSDGDMEEAHERLTRGHIHAMGLGILSISVSILLSFLSANHKVKTVASTCLGTGGFFYPFAWIIMGYRTTALGAEVAAESVIPIVGLSILLVLAGILITLFFLIKDFLHGRL